MAKEAERLLDGTGWLPRALTGLSVSSSSEVSPTTAVVTTAAACAAGSVRVAPALGPAKCVAEAAQRPRPGLQRGRRIDAGMLRAAMEDACRHSDTEGGRDPSSTTESTQAKARVRGGRVCVGDGSVVALPTEETADRELLAGLLASSQGTAYASALLQYFPSIGHVISAEASQLADAVE